MNKPMRFLTFSLVLLAGLSLAISAQAQGKKTAAGEEFFIVSSVDQTKSQLLLKRPTEVTLLMKVSDKTQIRDEKGKSIRLSDLRAGDTLWVVSAGSAGGEPVASRIRKGPMTVEELHRYYLDYPAV